MNEQNNETKKTTNKKRVLIGLFSIAILGSGVAYATLTQNKDTMPKEPIQSVSKPKKEKQKKDNTILDKQFNAEKKEKKKEDKTTKSKEKRDILAGIAGERKISPNSKERLFGIPVNKQSSSLIDQLAVALDNQQTKELAREKQRVVQAAEKTSETNANKLKEMNKPVLLIEEKPLNPENPTDPISPEKPIDPVKPIEPEKPIDPEKPVDPVVPEKPDMSQLVDQSRKELTQAEKKANRLNRRLAKVKNHLVTLTTIGDTTQEKKEQIEQQWDTLSKLINEYNEISSQIKELITDEGVVLPINQELYQEIYNKAQAKVTEIKEAQQLAGTKITELDKNIKAAETVANQLEEITENYQNNQKPAVEQVVNETNQAVNTAQQTPEVAQQLTTEINQAQQAQQNLQETNQTVVAELDKANATDNQAAIDQAQSQLNDLKAQETIHNETVNQVEKDFAELPKPVEQQLQPVEEQPNPVTQNTTNDQSGTTDKTGVAQNGATNS